MEQKEEKQSQVPPLGLSVSQKAEVVAKFAAAALSITYVSGYLIVTSHLETYGIHLGSSEFLRTKYIYVGFQYLLFLVLVACVFMWLGRGLARLFERLFQRFFYRPRGPLDVECELAKEPTNTRYSSEANGQESRKKLLGDSFVALILLVFILEMLFLNPERLGDFLPFQALYLFGVTLYHFSFHRELREPYKWGRVHGAGYVENMRGVLIVCQFVAFALGWTGMVLRKCQPRIQETTLHKGLIRGVLVCVTAAMVAVLLTELLAFPGLFASNADLESLDKEEQLRKQRRSISVLWTGSKLLCKSLLAWRVIVTVVTVTVSTLFVYGYLAYVEREWTGGVPGTSRSLDVSLALVTHALTLALTLNLGFTMYGVDIREKQFDLPGLGESGLIMDQGLERITKRIGVFAIIYIASVLSFAYVWYPYIPVQKSGGNFATAKKVCVKLVPSVGCPSSLLPTLLANEAFIQIEGDSEWSYFANDKQEGECKPGNWSTPGYNKNYCRPFVYAVRQNCVVGVTNAAERKYSDDSRCPMPPTITTLSRSSADFMLTVKGTGFIRDSVVYFNGRAQATTYVSATQLRAAILDSDNDSAGTPSVTVMNPGPGGDISSSASRRNCAGGRSSGRVRDERRK